MKILIAAGGTGGHLYPGISLGRELKERNCAVAFVVRINDSCREILRRENFDFMEISCAPFFGQSPVVVLKGLVLNFKGIFQGIKTIKNFRPDCVVGFGAYVSVPVVFAAFLMRVPVLLHEQNVSPGWANRLCSLFSKKVAVSFSETEKYFPKKAFLIGNPVRKDLIGKNRADARRRMGLKENRTTVLIFGGSGGARTINQWVLESLGKWSELKDSVQFLHLTGNSEYTEKLKKGYETAKLHSVVLDYSHAMGDCYASADLAVCRSGASTLAELIVTQTPAILIPYPYAIGEHQKKNAIILERAGAGLVLLEFEKTSKDFAFQILTLVRAPEHLNKMHEAYKKLPREHHLAAQKLADAVIELIQT